MIRALATSLGGSEHIVTGGVKDKQTYQWKTEEEARKHLETIGWTNVRFAIDTKATGSGSLVISWDDQSKTEHQAGSGSFVYLRGGPTNGRKISKSELNG